MIKIKFNFADKFFLFSVILYGIIYLFNPKVIIQGINDTVSTSINILPILIFVFLFMFLINLFLKDEMIKKYLGEKSGLKGWVYVIFSGVIIPSPPYIVIPLLGDLKKKGMRTALIVTFLYSRNLQIAFLPVMAYYFGILYTIINAFYVFIFAILSGIIIEKLVQD